MLLPADGGMPLLEVCSASATQSMVPPGVAEEAMCPLYSGGRSSRAQFTETGAGAVTCGRLRRSMQSGLALKLREEGEG